MEFDNVMRRVPLYQTRMDAVMATIKYRSKTVELDTLSLDELQEVFLVTHKIIATIEEQLAYTPIVEVGQPMFDVSGATFALKQFKVSLPLIEQAIAVRLREQRIAQHEKENQPKAITAKVERQLALAEHFVQVARERLNTGLFDALVVEAKKRRKASREQQA